LKSVSYYKRRGGISNEKCKMKNEKWECNTNARNAR